MDLESLSAVRESALDYFNRSRALQRRRGRIEHPGGDEAEGWQDVAALGWPGMLAPESAGGLALGLDGAAEIFRAAGEHAAPEPLLAVAASARCCWPGWARLPRMRCSPSWPRAAACPRWPGRRARAT